jgi:hypothetical protein
MSGMEFVSLFLGVPGLVQTCVHGYRTLLASKNIAKDASLLHSRLRIQEATDIRDRRRCQPRGTGRPKELVGEMEL